MHPGDRLLSNAAFAALAHLLQKNSAILQWRRTRGVKTMLNDRQLKNLKRRIQRAKKTFAVMGDMMLTMEFQHAYSLEELLQIRNYVGPYPSLDENIVRLGGRLC